MFHNIIFPIINIICLLITINLWSAQQHYIKYCYICEQIVEPSLLNVPVDVSCNDPNSIADGSWVDGSNQYGSTRTMFCNQHHRRNDIDSGELRITCINTTSTEVRWDPESYVNVQCEGKYSVIGCIVRV